MQEPADIPPPPAPPPVGPWVLGGLGLAWLGLWPLGFVADSLGEPRIGETAIYTAANLLPFLPIAVLPILAYGGRYFVAFRVLSVLWWLGLAGSLTATMFAAVLLTCIRPEQLDLAATDPPAFQRQTQFARADFTGTEKKWPDSSATPGRIVPSQEDAPAAEAKSPPTNGDRPAAAAPIIAAATPGDWEAAGPPGEWKRGSPPPTVELFVRDVGTRLLRAVGLLFLVFLLSAACFLPPVRRLAARVTPADPNDFLHATALATTILVTGACLVPLIVANDPPVLAMFRTTAGDAKDVPGRAVPGKAKPTPADRGAEAKPAPDMPALVAKPGPTLDDERPASYRATAGLAGKIGADLADSRTALQLGTVLPLIWVVPLGMLSVGYLWQRSPGEALARLGFVAPRAWHIALALGVTTALVLLAPLLDAGVSRVWRSFGGRPTEAEGVRFLFEFALTPLGAICVGIFAGVNEEMFFRGLLQPKVGILLSNLCFTAVHALQYHGDGLIVVFMLGLTLALVRKYTNTTTSALVHGLYDAVLLTLASIGVSGY